MDSGTIIIAAVFIAICILPFIFTGTKYRKQKKQLLQELYTLAAQNQVKLSDYEICGNFAIGIDKNSRYVFFSRKVQDEMTVQSTTLNEISLCKLNSASRVLEDGEKVIDRIELVMQQRIAGQTPVSLCLYNSDYDSLTLKGELQVAMKWDQTIGNILKQLKKKEHMPVSAKKTAVV